MRESTTAAAEQEQRPRVLGQIQVETDEELLAVRLRHDEAQVLESPFADLVTTYSPTFVILPEGQPDTDRPSKNGRHDYHPRGVDIFLRPELHSRPIAPTGIGAWSFFVVITFIAVVSPAVILFMATDTEMLFLLPTEVLYGVFGALGVIGLFALRSFFTRGPSGEDSVRDAVAADPGRLSRTTISSADAPDAGKIWNAYCDRVSAEEGRQRRMSYVRVIEDDGMVVLQYWQFYRYNDWWNEHEADWEVVMVYLPSTSLDDDPVAVAYSSHLAGYWRPWPAVQKDRKSHPVAYVARGSHAQYFASVRRGYDAVFDQPWDLLLLRGRVRLTGERDFVGTLPSQPDEATYELRAIPEDVESMDPRDERWPQWWWLQYRGGWGHPDWILSPSRQVRKWEEPVSWAAKDCLADAGTWEHVVARG